jgi:hypothetical protein
MGWMAPARAEPARPPSFRTIQIRPKDLPTGSVAG